MQKKRCISAMLSVLVFVMGLSACGWENEITIEQSEETVLFDAEDEITIVIPSDEETPYQEDWKLWQYLIEYSGATVKVDARASKDYETLVTLMLSDSKTMPDLLYLNDLGMLESEHYSALIALDDHLDLMPDYTEAVESIFPESRREAIELTRKCWNGKLYSLPVIGNSDLETTGWMYRKDVFEQHGLSAPQTMDELYEVCKKLKRLYPSSYPLVVPGNLDVITLLAPGFRPHLDYGAYYDFDEEEWRLGATEPQMKELLAWVLKMKREGLMHPQVGALGEETYERVMEERKVFFTIDQLFRQSEFGMVGMMPPRANTETGQNRVGRPLRKESGYVVCNSQNEARILNAIRFLNLLYTEEVSTLLSWGKKDETYTVDDSGTRHWILSGEETAKSKYGFTTAGLFQCVEDAAYNEFLTKGNRVDCSTAEYAERYVNPSKWLMCKGEEEKILEEYESKLYDYCEEMMVRFLCGLVPLDEWDVFVEGCEAYSPGQVLLAYENAWKRIRN